MSANQLTQLDPQSFVSTLAHVSPSLGEWARGLLADGNHTVDELARKLETAFHLVTSDPADIAEAGR